MSFFSFWRYPLFGGPQSHPNCWQDAWSPCRSVVVFPLLLGCALPRLRSALKGNHEEQLTFSLGRVPDFKTRPSIGRGRPKRANQRSCGSQAQVSELFSDLENSLERRLRMSPNFLPSAGPSVAQRTWRFSRFLGP